MLKGERYVVRRRRGRTKWILIILTLTGALLVFRFPDMLFREKKPKTRPVRSVFDRVVPRDISSLRAGLRKSDDYESNYQLGAALYRKLYSFDPDKILLVLARRYTGAFRPDRAFTAIFEEGARFAIRAHALAGNPRDRIVAGQLYAFYCMMTASPENQTGYYRPLIREMELYANKDIDRNITLFLLYVVSGQSAKAERIADRMSKFAIKNSSISGKIEDRDGRSRKASIRKHEVIADRYRRRIIRHKDLWLALADLYGFRYMRGRRRLRKVIDYSKEMPTSEKRLWQALIAWSVFLEKGPRELLLYIREIRYKSGDSLSMDLIYARALIERGRLPRAREILIRWKDKGQTTDVPYLLEKAKH